MATTKTMVHEDVQAAKSIQLKHFQHTDSIQNHSSSSSDTLKDQIIQRQEQKKDDGFLEAASNGLPSVPNLQKWNEPRGNIARFIACFFTFFVMGLGDAAYGALLPYVSDTQVILPHAISAIPNEIHLN